MISHFIVIIERCQLTQNTIKAMHLMQKMMNFIEESSEKLRLNYQSTLQAIQIISLLDYYHPHRINELLGKNYSVAKCFALSLLNLCCKLYEKQEVHMREYVKLVDSKYRDIAIEHIEKSSMHSEDRFEHSITPQEIEQLIKEYEIAIMLFLKWKLSMPNLYDEVIVIAYAWDRYTNELAEFPLKFQSPPNNREAINYSQNHNFLVKNIRICLYNFNHLIKQASLQTISNQIRRLSLALFFATIKQMLKDQVRMQAYILSPKMSIAFLLNDFYKKYYSVQAEDISGEIYIVSEVLDNYRIFRERSKQKKEPVKKMTHKSNKLSQDKENVLYYVNRYKNNKSKGKKPEQTDQRSEKLKSRSRSKKEVEKNMKEKGKLVKSKECILLKANSRKSTSTKSILTRNLKDKQPEPTELKKKVIKFSKSRVSKRSEKSQLNSKIIPPSSTLEGEFCSKSTYWLKSTTLAKTDKKSTNSSIRMKMR